MTQWLEKPLRDRPCFSSRGDSACYRLLYAMSGWRVQQLCARVHDADARGGASIACVPYPSSTAKNATSNTNSYEHEHAIVIFGGVNREQAHYNDLILSKRGSWQNLKNDPKKAGGAGCGGVPIFEKAIATGDTPPPRSGHAVAALPSMPYMLLHGGIDFAEEVCYNDLYVLNIDALEWRYVGEAGEEIPARNSHSLAALPCASGGCYLVLYGGASPENGVFGDTYYAHVTNYSDFDDEKFFVKWELLPECDENGPGKREMHSTCVVEGELIIFGGRREDGTLLSDSWSLATCITPTPTAADSSSPPPLRWLRRHDLELPQPLCSHGCTALPGGRVCIYGGFGSAGIVNDFFTAAPASTAEVETVFATPPTTAASRWHAQECSGDIGGRFGFAMCALPKSLLGEGAEGMIVFGGVDAQRDYCDVYSVVLSGSVE